MFYGLRVHEVHTPPPTVKYELLVEVHSLGRVLMLPQQFKPLAASAAEVKNVRTRISRTGPV
ncbi:MAG: hypothetical protein NTW87_36640 [Planctomycetota bacterium]|nr:hypothetical protein [Planctomycetota bacterium]